ncbi:hypothetical protein HanHA300_Chr02g0038511 [Helianthus annuus]|nr:hypothetical protein HanHA300_Chr02g0038511 [Helianthus annuus]
MVRAVTQSALQSIVINFVPIGSYESTPMSRWLGLRIRLESYCCCPLPVTRVVQMLKSVRYYVYPLVHRSCKLTE